MKNNQIRATSVSCKECRRLKIKCDRMVPCGTCTKRGLQSLCPDGQLSGAKGSRYVLATTEESWNRIQALCVRIQDLEFALERAQGLVANERHPLLDEELIKIGQDPRAVVKTEPGKSVTALSEEVPIANFGTMKISKSGSYRWFGTTALAAMMLDESGEGDSGPSHDVDDTLVTHEGGSSIPGHNYPPSHDLKARALQQLPPRQRALQLIDTFIECYGRWSTIVARSTVIDTLFTVAYDGDATSLSAYNLSSLFSILALGSLYDQPYDPTGWEFKAKRKWAKTLFLLEWPKGPSTIDELESLLLLYRASWPFSETNPSENYDLLVWGIKLAERIGLHRDPERLNLSTDECLRRRRVFWALWFQDSMVSVVLGQPPTIAKGFIDCKPPDEPNMAGFEDIHPRVTLIMHDIISHFLESRNAPPYAAVLRIDQKIRDLSMDPRPQANSRNSPMTVQTAGAAYTRSLRCALLLALHRTYFSYAVQRPKEDPVAGRRAPSIAAIFEAATALLEGGQATERYSPWMHVGYAPFWNQYHTAMLVLYAFSIYLPYWPRSGDAMKMADSALSDLFYPNAKDHERIANYLPSILKAQQKAQESWSKYQNGQWTHPASSTFGESSESDSKQDILLNSGFVVSKASEHDTSRDSTPSGHHAPSVYPETTSSSSAYRGNWQPEGQFDEANPYKNNTSMDWSHAAAPPVPRMEPPPHSAGLYPNHSQHPSQHTTRALTTLQIPGEVIGIADHRPDRHAAIRRVRGLSRAHSFPSDQPGGYSSAGSTKTRTFQSMQIPSNVPSPAIPVGSTSSMYSLGHQHVHEPWIQTTLHPADPYRLPPHSHGHIPPPTVTQHNPLSTTDAGAIPIHVLQQSWDKFYVYSV